MVQRRVLRERLLDRFSLAQASCASLWRPRKEDSKMEPYSKWQCLTCEKWHITPRTGTLCPGAACLWITAKDFARKPQANRLKVA